VPGARLLLIDDAELAFDYLSALLVESGGGHTLEWRSNYQEGLSALLSGSFDLCFLDYRLGQSSGLELLKEAKAKECRTGIVMLTGHGNLALDHEAMRAGALDYLVKSEFSAEHFERLVRYLTERVRTLERLRDSEERYSLAVRGANDGIWDWHVKEDAAHLSARFKMILGFAEDEVPSDFSTWRCRVHPDDGDLVDRALEAHIQGDSPFFECEHRVRHKDGTWRHVLMRGQAVRDSAGRARRVAGSLTDVTSVRAKDPLTALPNRVLYLDRLEMAFLRARRDPNYSFALLFIDLDRFKSVNDSLGHGLGDELLTQIAQRLLACVRLIDTVARLGGDEFVVLLDDPREPDGPARVAQRILEALQRPFTLSGQPVFSSASIGIVTSSPSYQRADELLRDADTAMYEAKSAGRGQYVLFDPAMRKRALHVLSMESGLRRALSESSELLAHYQPIFDLERKKVLGFEALVRWQHPTRGLLYPGDFLAIAEDTRLISHIDLYVIREACQQLARWQYHTGRRDLFMSVNASRVHFGRSDFPADLERILRDTGVSSASIRLEVTESVAMGERQVVLPQFLALDAMGVQLLIDDFGVGFASLSVLQDFPFRGLKIDRSFVSQLTQSPRHASIVRALMTLAQSLDMTTVAEGIETEAQRLALLELGCRSGQGYFLGKPMTVSAATSILSSEPRLAIVG
jgi:diguanylate cyclase (GGDEF)-like protein/PAS domain S-box-containing protein